LKGDKTTTRQGLKLHEDQVPKFKKALTCRIFQGAFPTPILRSPIEKKLRTRTARAHLTHRPKIILNSHPYDPAGREVLLPKLEGFQIFFKDRNPNVDRVKAKHPCCDFKGHIDGLFFKIITEGEVPNHFEKG
jgi:hypothetical protein